MTIRSLPALLALFLLPACVTAPLPGARALDPYETGMVSAADPRAAKAGAQILRKGGSATDAAIATMLALTVVEPQSSGIGGGGFYLRGTRNGAIETIDGRETAPAGAAADWFMGKDGEPLAYNQAVMSGLSIGVPGNIALAAQAHKRHGTLAWAQLFAPAIKLASDGWVLTDRFVMYLGLAKARASRDPMGRALFFDKSGKPLPVGTHVRNPALAATLDRIAHAGPDAFYQGEPGAGMAAKIAQDTPRKITMTELDVMTYKAQRREPVCGAYRAYRICGMGPPSSGATTVIAILGQLERFDISRLSADSPVFWHIFAESQRLAYADRERFLADADFVNVPVAKLIDRAYLARRGSLINAQTTLAEVRPGLELAPPDGDEPAEQGTSHFVAVDSAGTAVSYTSTIEGPFGSGLMFGGFYLNNELTDFSFASEKDGQAVANRVEGGKRPRSSMAPTLVYDSAGKLVLAIGAAGGGTIPVQVARGLIGFIDWNMPVKDALALPMLYAPSDKVSVEKGSALEAMIPALKKLGHDEVLARRLPIKSNAIALYVDRLDGAADPRSEGAVSAP